MCSALPTRSNLVALLLLLAAGPLAAQTSPNSPPRIHPRQGMWINAGLGAGFGEGMGGGSGNLAVGGTFGPHYLLGVGTSDWRMGIDRATLTMGTLDLRTQVYPEVSGGFFLTGGLGLGYFWMSDSGTGPDVGSGVLLGLGYDARIGENTSITTFINKVWIDTPDPRGSVAQVGVGISFH